MNQDQEKAIRQMESLAKLMDNRFRIPGTNIRFGLDSIAGLVPGIGDMSTFLVSGYMIMILAQNGASGYLLARMCLNVIVDALFGMVPVLGDIFDFAFKANVRNMKLMKAHYVRGRYKGGAWKVIVPVLAILFLIIAAILYATYRLITYLF